jgi:hypothetical protein
MCVIRTLRKTSYFDRVYASAAALVKRLRMNDVHPFTLWVGGAAPDAPRIHHVAWVDVPESVPPSFQFSRIVVVPEAQTDELQLRLIEKLKAEIVLTTQSRARVVWLLNEHVASGVPQAVNAGSLTPFRPVVNGSVEMLIGPRRRVAADVARAVTVGAAALNVALWKSDDGRVRVPVGVLSRDLRWCFVPAHPEAERLVNRLGLLRQYAIILLCLFLAAGAVYKVQHRMPRDEAEFRQSISELGLFRLTSAVSEDEELIDLESPVTPPWNAPERNLARQLFLSVKPHLANIRADFGKEQNSYELWRAANRESIAYFDLAVMSGDLVSAYRIAREAKVDGVDREEWSRHLTATFWQTALEAAHELDFEKAKRYTDFYLACMDALMAGATSPEDLAPQRNRTLARILQRELANRRVTALCTQPGVATSFAHLLGAGWGESLPKADDPELERRRAMNAAVNCSNRVDTPAINYASLADLEQYPTTQTPGSEPCVIASLECDFMTIREHLGDRNRGSSREGLEFAAHCSYLSDDMIDMVVLAAGFDSAEIGRIPMNALQRAMSCLERGPSDFATMIGADLSHTDCRNLDWDGFTTAAPLHTDAIRQLVARCRKKAA